MRISLQARKGCWLYLYWTLYAAIFWSLWEIAGRAVPVYAELALARGNRIALPVHISRWGDVVALPIVSALLSLAWRRLKKIEVSEEIRYFTAGGSGYLAFLCTADAGLLLLFAVAFVSGFFVGVSTALGRRCRRHQRERCLEKSLMVGLSAMPAVSLSAGMTMGFLPAMPLALFLGAVFFAVATAAFFLARRAPLLRRERPRTSAVSLAEGTVDSHPPS